jgi:hypothetical protein
MIEWDWIVDETRERERAPSWDDPTDFARSVGRQYRRDFWNQQPVRCELFSEKGTASRRCATDRQCVTPRH